MSNHPTSSYQHASALGASPIGQIVALYDAILRDFMQALNAMKSGRVELRVQKLNHALTIIGHLQCVLDHDRGGVAARNFARFYEVTRGMIVDSNARASSEVLEKLVELYSGVRKAWYQIDQQLSVKQPEPETSNRPVIASRAREENSRDEDAEVVQSHWST